MNRETYDKLRRRPRHRHVCQLCGYKRVPQYNDWALALQKKITRVSRMELTPTLHINICDRCRGGEEMKSILAWVNEEQEKTVAAAAHKEEEANKRDQAERIRALAIARQHERAWHKTAAAFIKDADRPYHVPADTSPPSGYMLNPDYTLSLIPETTNEDV